MIRYLSFVLFDHDKHFPKADFQLFKWDCASQCWLGEERDLSMLPSHFLFEDTENGTKMKFSI